MQLGTSFYEHSNIHVGGIFGESYASLGGIEKVVPVDEYILACPPRPQALLHGILLAVGRFGEKRSSGPNWRVVRSRLSNDQPFARR